MNVTEVSDVSAVVLSLGEGTTQAAVQSLQGQTMKPREIIMVEGVRPFHRALNAGASQVKTPFFVQVDADMILDPRCIAELRSGVSSDTGIVIARLRDALTEQVVGVKLFRASCFEHAQFRDLISPDTDFVDAIERFGWTTSEIGRLDPQAESWATFGDHRPDYTPSYTYRKHVFEGARYRYRQVVTGLLWRFARLQLSSHPVAWIAQIGLAQGLFTEADSDLLGSSYADFSFARLETFLHRRRSGYKFQLRPPPAGLPAKERFRAFYAMGHGLAESDPSVFAAALAMLTVKQSGVSELFDKVALCRGLLADNNDAESIDADHRVLSAFVAAGDKRRHPYSVASDLEPIKEYASAAGISRFVLTGADIEYERAATTGCTDFCDTGRRVWSLIDRKGRARIGVPFQWLGHVVCTEPEKVVGVVWCSDLMKAGYLSVHVLTPWGPRRISVPRQLLTNILDRLGMRFESSRDSRRCFERLTKHRTPRQPMEPNRVLMIAPSLNRGGSERQLLITAAGLLQQGFDVRLIALDRLEPGVPSFEAEIERLGVRPQYCSDLGVRRNRRWSSTPETDLLAADLAVLPPWIGNKLDPLLRMIETDRPAIVHAWLDGPAVIGGLAACVAGVPRIVIAQGNMSVRHFRSRPIPHMRSVYRYVASNPAVVLENNSAAGAEDYERWLDLPRGTIRVLRNGLMPGTVRIPDEQEVRDFRVRLGIPADACVVGTLMRLADEKDPDLWIDTAAEIAKARPDSRFLIFGHGPLHGAILDRARRRELTDRLVLADAMSDVGLGYAALDVLLLTSSVEGLPNVLVEAQAAGRPVVATDVGGTREAIDDGRTGLIVAQRLPRLLARAVLRILGDASFRERVRTEGPSFAARQFGYERMLRETIELYRLPVASG